MIFAPLPTRTFTVVEIDPPWRFKAGTKSRPQHYDRMTFQDILDLPVKDLLHPDGARVFLWITAPLGDRIKDVAKAWGLKYSTMLPWVKLWPRENPLFFMRDSFAKGTGFEVSGNVEYVAILKHRTPQSIKGRPFPPFIIAPRREHSRKPVELKLEIEQRLDGPFAEVFSRSDRAGWAAWGNEAGKFGDAA